MRGDSDHGLARFREAVARKKSGGYFDNNSRIVISRAPGRLDLMGGIADYSGSRVLQFPIEEACFAAAQLAGDRRVLITSLLSGGSAAAFQFEASLDDLGPDGKFATAAKARAYFASDPPHRWASYVLGGLIILAETEKPNFNSGLRLLISSGVPLGKGVSSSAALEVSSMKAVAGLFDLDLDCRQLAILCQRVENEVVGAPCGVMDQMTSACGIENSLIELVCQPAELRGTIVLPDEIDIWGIDSGIRHSVAGADYGTVRTAAFMGHRMLAGLTGVEITRVGEGRVAVAKDPFGGYLANIDPDEFEKNFAQQLPSSITGAEFLQRYEGVIDPHSSIIAEREYPVRAATAHPIHENARVTRFAQLLRTQLDDVSLTELGALMYASHDSYSECGLGSDGTDSLIGLVRTASPSSGLFGAKITGGGSGGTVAVLTRKGGRKEIERIAAEYRTNSGRTPYVFSGSSPGAFQFGIRNY